MIRAVLDINVIISSMVSELGFPFKLWSAWDQGDFELVFSEGMVIELAGKLALPRLATRYDFTENKISFIINLLRTQTNLIYIPVNETLEVITGDPEDDIVLATARLGKVDYLVTGDKKLLDLKKYKSVKIITPREFVNILGGH